MPDRTQGPTRGTVVVTGANSGIGLATALELARTGYDVWGTVRGADKAEVVRAAAAERDLSVRTVLADVTDAGATEAALAEVEAASAGGIWAVVNNAGFAQAGAVEDVGDDAARRQLEVNLVAPARIARLVLPAMRRRGDGRIVNVSSLAGRVSAPLTGWYAASKHGLEALSDALRTEVAGFGVKVILIEPGGFGTNIWAEGQNQLPDAATDAYAAAYARSQAVTSRGHRLPDPVWVGRAVRLALMSPAPLARYLVGVDAVGGVLAETFTPTAVSDYVKRLATGLVPVPERLRFLGR